jgi:hypothetical protein
MPTRQEIWGAVLPPEGLYCVVGIKNKIVHSQTFHTTLLDADVAVDHLDEHGINSFIAVASFQTDRNRTAANAAELKSFFLDLDCDADDPKKYPDQTTALADLKRYVKDVNLPRPIIVNSGNGLHAYWPLTAAVKRDEWKVVAERFKASCVMAGLKIDTSVPADAARVLRAVGSRNHKNPDDPMVVEAYNNVTPMEFSAFRSLMGVRETDTLATVRPTFDKDKLKDLPASSFRMILKKSMEGNGCKQIADYVENQATATEPVWRAVLSVAQVCKDRDKAIHLISNEHPGYDWQATEDKANGTNGSYSCQTFSTTSPGGCDGCPHRGKINNPLKLGRGETEVAAPQDNVVRDAKEPSVTYTIPEYPFPYLRGKNGGVFMQSEDKDGNRDDVSVYENDFYLVNTVDDPLDGMSALFRVHLPHDGVKEFLIPMKDMIAKETLGKRVAEQGIGTTGKQMEAIMSYVGSSVKSYQKSKRAEKSRLQFGWADNYSAFIVGDRQITATGVQYSPPSSVTVGLVQHFRQAGTLEEWQKVVSFYNRPGMELHMFSTFVGFSSPLVPFSKEARGGIINLYSDTSGTGKTTMLKVANSIFGHPEDLMLIKSDTMNSRISRIGTLQNITPTIDEITNEPPEVTSDFMYDFLQMRGKNRLKHSHNIERINTTNWRTNCMVTANSPVEDKLHVKKRSPDGELARFLDLEYYKGNDLSKTETDAIFAPLRENYGWAGDIFIQYVIQNMTTVIEMINSMHEAIDKAAGLTQRERYWSGLVVTPLVGGLVARSAGVLHFSDADFRRVFRWVVGILIAKRTSQTKSIKAAPDLVLGAFLSEHINDVLVINSGISRGAGAMDAPIREPRGKLYIRYEPDTKLIYVSKSKFRLFCVAGQLSYAGVLDAMTKQKVFLGEKKVRMGKGMALSQPEAVLIFTNKGEALFDDAEVLGEDARHTD